MTTIINISNHNLSATQIGSSTVVELPEALKTSWAQITPAEVESVVSRVKSFVQDTYKFDERTLIHIAGHPSTVYATINTLSYIPNVCDSDIVYANSVRESVEEVVDGKTIKRNVFTFNGWYSYLTNEEVE